MTLLDLLRLFSSGSAFFYSSLTAVVKHVDVQRQVGSSDCGLMAIAFTVSLCSGLDPHTLKYDQSKLRSDFLSCVESGCLLPFHIPGATRRVGRAYFVHVKEVPVFVCQFSLNLLQKPLICP